jgi:hypothetical protein
VPFGGEGCDETVRRAWNAGSLSSHAHAVILELYHPAKHGWYEPSLPCRTVQWPPTSSGGRQGVPYAISRGLVGCPRYPRRAIHHPEYYSLSAQSVRSRRVLSCPALVVVRVLLCRRWGVRPARHRRTAPAVRNQRPLALFGHLWPARTGRGGAPKARSSSPLARVPRHPVRVPLYPFPAGAVASTRCRRSNSRRN